MASVKGYAITMDGQRYLSDGLSGHIWDDQPLLPVVYATPDQAWAAVGEHLPAFELDGVDVVPYYGQFTDFASTLLDY